MWQGGQLIMMLLFQVLKPHLILNAPGFNKRILSPMHCLAAIAFPV